MQKNKVTNLNKKTKDKIDLKKQSTKDSITISVALRSGEKTGFNIVDRFFYSDYIEFINKSKKDSILVKTILKSFDNQIMFFGSAILKNGDFEISEHYYLIDKEISNLNFKYSRGKMDLLNIDSTNVIKVDKFYKDYQKLVLVYDNSNQFDKERLESKLDSIHKLFNKEIELQKKPLYKKLNDYLYMDKLQKIHPLDERVDNYLINIKELIAGQPLDNLIYFYIKNRIHTFNFKKLNTCCYSTDYIELMSIGMFNFLRHEDNRNNTKFQPALKWLKTTDLYRKNRDYISKELKTIDNTKFKQGLKNLNLLGISNKKTIFHKITQQNPSDFYLIDFWATWCGPCIDGIKKMDKMVFPENVVVISLSVDKDKNKWVKKTKELDQKISFLVDNKIVKNKDFLNFIELQTIPRYVLIDKKMNLIDISFLKPQEPGFLKKLNELE